MSEFVEFKIDVAPNGTGSVKVGDEEVGDRITGYTLQVAVGQPPILTLFERTSGGVTGEGIVQVTGRPDPSKIVSFLNSLDLEELERQSLSNASWGESPVIAMVRVMKEWASVPG